MSESEVTVPSAQVVVRVVAGVLRVFRECPVCHAFLAERKVAEGRFTDTNYSRHFAGQHKGGLMATKTDDAPTITAEEKAAARSEASRKAAATRKANAEAAKAESQPAEDGQDQPQPAEAPQPDQTPDATPDQAPQEPGEGDEQAQQASAGNGGQRRTRGRREDSAVSQAIALLKELGRPASAKELFELGVERGLMQGLKGKTPVATLSAQLYGAEQRGDVSKPERGKFAAA